MPQSEFFLIGDSHAIAIGNAAKANRRPFSGGPLGAGRELETDFYSIDGDNLTLESPVMGPVAHLFETLLSFKGPVISTMGFNAHRYVKHHLKWRDDTGLTASHAVYDQGILDTRLPILNLTQTLIERGVAVFAIPAPARMTPADKPLFDRFERVFSDALRGVGATVLDIQSLTCDSEGHLRPEFERPNDDHHANTRFGDAVLDSFDRANKVPVSPRPSSS